MKKPILISLIGAPASGKGYIGECIIKDLTKDYGYNETDIETISISAMIKSEIKSQSELGKNISEKRNSGKLINDIIIDSLLEKALKNTKTKVIMLDGYPRTGGQVLYLKKISHDYKMYVIFRDADREKILERVKNRRICSISGETHTAQDNDSVCTCGGKLIKRKDDENIEIRLAEYERETKPAVEMLKKSDLKFYYVDSHIDGCVAAKKIIKEILEDEPT